MKPNKLGRRKIYSSIICVVLMKINNNILLYCLYLNTIKRQEAEIQGLFHLAKANLRYFLARFQSLQLTSTQPQNHLALNPLAPKSHVSLKVRTQI
jgi:hypothetical protein